MKVFQMMTFKVLTAKWSKNKKTKTLTKVTAVSEKKYLNIFCVKIYYTLKLCTNMAFKIKFTLKIKQIKHN